MRYIINFTVIVVIFIVINQCYVFWRKKKFHLLVEEMRTLIKETLELKNAGEVIVDRMKIASEFLTQWEENYKNLRSFRAIVFDELGLLKNYINVAKHHDKRLRYCNPSIYMKFNLVAAEAQELMYELHSIIINIVNPSQAQAQKIKDASIAVALSIAIPKDDYDRTRQHYVKLMCLRMDIDHIELFI